MSLLEQHSSNPEVVEYLNTPPDRQTLKEIIARGINAGDLIRTGESAFQETGMNIETMSEDDIIETILANPSLLQRPIIVLGDKAIIGRPPTKVLELIE